MFVKILKKRKCQGNGWYGQHFVCVSIRYCCNSTQAIHSFRRWTFDQGHHRSLISQQDLFNAFLSLFLSFYAGTHTFLTEGEHVELAAITKEQSGTYECIASNGILEPDVRTVQVTVNCKDQNYHCGNIWRGKKLTLYIYLVHILNSSLTVWSFIMVSIWSLHFFSVFFFFTVLSVNQQLLLQFN